MDINGASLAREVGSPHVLEEAVTGQDHPGVAGQRDEQVELPRPELQASLADHCLAPTGVEPQCADLDRSGAGGGGGRAAEDRLHPRHQGPGIERLGDVVVGAQLEPDNRVHVVRPRREHQDRGLAAAPDLAADIEPILLRQHQVQDHEVRVVAQVERERIVTVARGDHGEALLLQVEAQKLHDVRLIVDHEDPLHGLRVYGAAGDAGTSNVSGR